MWPWTTSSARDMAEMQRARSRERDQRTAQAITMIAAAAALAALWPLAIVTAITYSAAWLTGAHPARLLRAATWSAPATAAYAMAAAIQDRPWEPGRLTWWAGQPYRDWKAATLDLIRGTRIPAAVLAVAPVAVPAGIAIGAGLWAWRSHQATHGLIGATALASVSWDGRQWRRQAATARRDARQPGRVPLATWRGVCVGTVIRVTRARWSRVLTIPLAEFSRHMVIVGATGSGKTTLMIRLWAGWLAAAMTAASDRAAPRPLLVVIDAKGGHDSRAKAAEARAALSAAGPVRYAIWPDVALSMWAIPPRELATLLHQLVDHGEGNAAYYADISQAAITLAVCAPGGPPRSSADLIDRLTPGWLQRAYAQGSPGQLERVAAARPHLPGIAMRYAVLLDRLGGALDGGAILTDADAWYCILEGTAEPSVAEAQAAALIELVARAAASTAGRRAILLAADDYSAVSRKVPLSNLYERGRSLGLGVQVSAQSWEGLGADDDERRRITATADGGIFLLRTPAPEHLVELAGTRRVLEGSRKTISPGRTGDEGNTRLAHTWIADPDRIRQLATGQAAFIRHGGATFVQVSTAAPSRPARPAPTPPPPALRGQDDQDTTPRLRTLPPPGSTAPRPATNHRPVIGDSPSQDGTVRRRLWKRRRKGA
jgi:hypothetical protein